MPGFQPTLAQGCSYKQQPTTESILMGMGGHTHNSSRNRTREESTASNKRITIHTHNSRKNRTREESTASDKRVTILVPACTALKKKAQSPTTTAAEHNTPNTSDILKWDTQYTSPHQHHGTARTKPVEKSGSTFQSFQPMSTTPLPTHSRETTDHSNDRLFD